MNKEIKKLWLEALRSGEYKQGQGQLHNIKEGTFCCLGVLCDIIDKNNIYKPKRMILYTDFESFDFLLGYLSNPMQKITGLDAQTAGNLLEMNDDQNKSFTEIADYIERAL